jgi:hypothetical protein
MVIIGIVISLFALLLDGLLILRGLRARLIRVYPLFYSYIIYTFCGGLGVYFIYWRAPRMYRSAYWIYFLVTILAEFMVLVEISDQIFRAFPALRYLGRALTVLISAGLGCFYVLPVIVQSTYRDIALLDFALRASITKIIILAVLFYLARHYGSPLGRNVAGLMLGFSIYVAMWAVTAGGAKVFGSTLFRQTLWFMAPVSAALSYLVWTISLWELAPATNMGTISPANAGDSDTVALELNRFNNELSKFLRK